jgi:hypothetical protein
MHARGVRRLPFESIADTPDGKTQLTSFLTRVCARPRSRENACAVAMRLWGMRAQVAMWACCLAGSLVAGERRVEIADFDGVNPLRGWTVSSDPESTDVTRSLTIGSGHTGRGALLEYQFGCDRGKSCGGAVAATWTPTEPVAVKRRGALSMWIRAAPEVRITFLVRDKSEGTKRYSFEVTTLEHPVDRDWRQVVIPLAAKSTGYWDEDHSGRPEGRVTAIGILAEGRYPQPIRGSVGFDDVQLLESPDQKFVLRTDLPLVPAPPGSAQLGPRLGISIHTLGDDSMLDAAREAGFSFVRADLLWRQVEKNGRYRFLAHDRLLNALETRRMGALWILDYGHPQHGGDPPRDPEDVAAFARYAEAAAAHFKGRNVRYEVWNEPNTERFWRPEPNATEYAALLKEATAAIHRADPGAQVASGGLGRIDLSFLEGMIAAGGAGEINAAAVHPYRRLAPESVAAELPLLRRLLLRGVGEKMEIWDTEWGYASYDYFSKNLRGDGHSALGRKRQAVLACREALTVWALGLPVNVWYDLRDDGDDPRNPEHNYGLLDAQSVDKPAMTALRALTHIAGDHIYAGMVRDMPDGAHAMRLDGTEDKVFAVWSEQPDSRITVRLPADGLVSVTNLVGESLKVRGNGRKEVEIALTETDGPVYIKFTSR